LVAPSRSRCPGSADASSSPSRASPRSRKPRKTNGNICKHFLMGEVKPFVLNVRAGFELGSSVNESIRTLVQIPPPSKTENAAQCG
jgi:hypothetical protein